MKAVSVIIPVYKDWPRLDRCIRSLKRQTFPAQNFEILIVNNEAATVKIDFALPENARVLHEPQPGSYAARNRAIGEAAGQILAFIDSDCVADVDWIANGVRRLTAEGDVRVAGPVKLFREDRTSYYAYLYDKKTAFRFEEDASKGTGGAGNLFVWTRTFKRVGLFDPELFSGGDNEWGYRAHRAGVPIVFAKDVVVHHPARQSIRDIAKKKRRIAGSAVRNETINGLTYLAKRLLPPVRQIKMFQDLARMDRLAMFFVIWWFRLNAAFEFVCVFFKLKRPARS